MIPKPASEEMTPQEEDWRRFQDVPSMVNHWDRPGWTSGRQAYFWYLTFDSPRLKTLAARFQEVLHSPHLDSVPLDGLHLTLSRVGWSDEVTPSQVTALSGRASTACSRIKPFPLLIGPLSGSAGAIRFSVSPWDSVVSLHQELRHVTQSALGTASTEAEFRPHVGLAYCNRAVSPALFVPDVARLRQQPPVETLVSHVELVLLRRQGRAYAWSTVSHLPLGSNA